MEFGLDSPLDGVPGDNFRFALFLCFNDLQLGNTISMATRIMSFDLVFISFKKSYFS